MERRYRERPAFFRHILTDPTPLSWSTLADWLGKVTEAGKIASGEASVELRGAARTAIVFRGGDPADPEYLAVEVSWAVDESDVRRAAQRAALLRKAGVRARAAVAGQRIQPEAVTMAEREGVARVIEEELDAEDDTASGGAAR